MKHVKRHYLGFGLVIAMLLLTSCAPLLSDWGIGQLPYNDGKRLDLVIGDISGTYSTSEVRTLVTSAWGQDEVLRSWFTIVERVVDPQQTFYLNVLLHPYEYDSHTSGNLKYGFTTTYTRTSTVTFELVDPVSGAVIAVGNGRGRDSSSSGRPQGLGALNAALKSGLRDVVRVYSGG